MKRILAFALIFTMLFTAMLGIMPAAEESAGPALDITEARLQFASNVYIEFKVAYTGIDDASTIKLSITNKAGEKKVLTAKSVNADEGYVVFQYTALSAKEIGDNLSIKAYVDGNDACFATVTYSALEYAIKAKAAASNSAKDQALVELLAAMLDYGAAAQNAFKNDYDYDLSEADGQSFGYGIVLVGGATDATRKSIVKIGEAANVAADSSVFKTATVNTAAAGYALYDMSFSEVAGATAKEGVTRYFYYGIDIAGNYVGTHDEKTVATTNINGVAGSTYWQSTNLYGYLADLNFNNYTGTSGQQVTFTACASNKPYMTLVNAINNKWSGWLDNPDSSVAATYFRQGDGFVTGKFNTFQNNAQYIGRTAVRGWRFTPYTASSAYTNANSFGPSSTYKIGSGSNASLTVYNGYMYINPGTTTEAYGMDYISIDNADFASTLVGNANPSSYENFLVDGKMTVSVSIALDANCLDLAALCCYSQDMRVGAQTRAAMFHIKNGKIYAGDEKYAAAWTKEVCSINTFDSANPEFTTVHFVIDTNKNGDFGTITAYTEDGSVITSGYSTGANFYGRTNANASAAIDTFAMALKGSAYLQRITLSEGDIFN